MSAFKGRVVDSRGRDSAIDRCDVSVQDQSDEAECRLIIKMICKHGGLKFLIVLKASTKSNTGVTKTYKLTYESVEIVHALFDKNSATNGWKISSRILKEYVEYFGPRTEQLDMLAKDGKAIFTSFTEKIMDGKGDKHQS